MRYAGIGGWKQMIMNGKILIRAGEFRSEVVGGLQRHVTAVAIQLGFGRIIKCPSIMAGNAAEQVGIIRVLTAQEFFIFIELVRDADLMASGTKLGGFVM